VGNDLPHETVHRTTPTCDNITRIFPPTCGVFRTPLIKQNGRS